MMDRTRRVWATGVAVLLVLLCAACGGGDSDPLPMVEKAVGGEGTLGLSLEGRTAKGLVVFFHGMDEDHREPVSDSKHKAMTEALVSDGYAVVSADAGGNALGNPASQAAYTKLINDAVTEYGTDRIFFVAESMGAVPALILYGENKFPVRGMVGVSPLMGLPPSVRGVDYVSSAWGGEVPDSADGMSWSPDRLQGKRFRLYASPTDTVIPKNAAADVFTAKFGGAAAIDLIKCSGDHVDETCLDGPGVVAWLNATP